jgi:DNA-binding transcriptional regulator YdaS (Cro superfamily)
MGTIGEGRPQEVKVRVATILRKAAEIVGSRAHLARYLEIEPHILKEWIDGVSDCPDEIVYKAVEIVLKLKS